MAVVVVSLAGTDTAGEVFSVLEREHAEPMPLGRQALDRVAGDGRAVLGTQHLRLAAIVGGVVEALPRPPPLHLVAAGEGNLIPGQPRLGRTRAPHPH